MSFASSGWSSVLPARPWPCNPRVLRGGRSTREGHAEISSTGIMRERGARRRIFAVRSSARVLLRRVGEKANSLGPRTWISVSIDHDTPVEDRCFRSSPRLAGTSPNLGELRTPLDERGRRLWAGAEADAMGHGGLVVRARLERRRYPIGKKVSAAELKGLNIEPDDSTAIGTTHQAAPEGKMSLDLSIPGP